MLLLKEALSEASDVGLQDALANLTEDSSRSASLRLARVLKAERFITVYLTRSAVSR